jgi:hypothetical protein
MVRLFLTGLQRHYRLATYTRICGILQPVLVIFVVIPIIAVACSLRTAFLVLFGWLALEKLAPLLLVDVGQQCSSGAEASLLIHKSATADNDGAATVIIVGGSAVGLATAAVLAQRGVPYLVLEKERDAGAAWLSIYS